jgi:hypothetical protein
MVAEKNTPGQERSSRYRVLLLFVPSGPPEYWIVLPMFKVDLPHSVFWPTHPSSPGTPSQTHPEVCFSNFLGICQSSQVNNSDSDSPPKSFLRRHALVTVISGQWFSNQKTKKSYENI